MNSKSLSDDMYEAAMDAWNTLTEIMEPEEKPFETLQEFKSFFNVIMDKLHSEEFQE